MKKETLHGLTVHVGPGADTGPMVVLLHGFGAPGTDLVPLANFIEAPPGTRFVFIEAVHRLADLAGSSMLVDPNARALWMIDMAAVERAMETGIPRDRSKDVPEGLVAARDKVNAVIDTLMERWGLDSSQVVLGGFSQGAMLSCDVALRRSSPFAALVLLSSTLLCEHEWTPLGASKSTMAVFQSHGANDDLLAFSLAKRVRDLFQGW